jgi:hypothetical protein
MSGGMQMRKKSFISAIVICLLCLSASVFGADDPIVKVFPSTACSEGWIMDEKVTLYNKDNLFDRINGEAELYFPYGFEVMASARYVSSQNHQVSIDADIYKMGSLLDAFGMYSNYRRADDPVVKVGAEGTSSSALLLFYQDRYFIRLQAGGTLKLDKDILLACAQSISKRLPADTGAPKELEVFILPSTINKSERYYAQSLLGYAFFRRGLIAEALLEGEHVQVFLVPEDSPASARRAFDQYRAYLEASGKAVQAAGTSDYISMASVDPLYGGVFIEQKGRYLVGVIRVNNIPAAKILLDRMKKKLGT